MKLHPVALPLLVSLLGLGCAPVMAQMLAGERPILRAKSVTLYPRARIRARIRVLSGMAVGTSGM